MDEKFKKNIEDMSEDEIKKEMIDIITMIEDSVESQKIILGELKRRGQDITDMKKKHKNQKLILKKLKKVRDELCSC